MSKHWRFFCAAVVAALVGMVGIATDTASAVGLTQNSMPSAVPFANTPQVLDGAVQGFAQVGSQIVASGTFTQFSDATANGGTTFSQPYVFSFDQTSGAVNRSFRPTVNGVVNAVLAGPNDTVYVGGNFNSINGTAVSHLAQLSVATGQLTSFRAPTLNGAVKDITLSGGRLFVGGIFTTAGGVAHGGLATLNPTTGALDPYMGIGLTGHHNYDGTSATAQAGVGVEKFDISPDGRRMVVIGNFTQADGQARDQAMVADLGSNGATVANWATDVFQPGCYTFAFDDYMRAVQFAPDGSYFVIGDTGGSNPGTHCDTMTRWETSVDGANVQPTWTAYTGGDSIFSLALSGTAVYGGGHPRWLNNPNGNDSAGAGAVPRPGLVALDPRTGLPLKWNPGRNPRGHGAEALLLTQRGLYVGSDTEYIGNRTYLRRRLAFFPLAGGATLPAEVTPSLPSNVFLAGRAAATTGAGVNDVVTRSYDGTTPGTDALAAGGGVTWSQARGAFLVDGTLYYGYPNGTNGYYLFSRSFDGTTFGPATALDPYNDPYWSNVSAGLNRWTQTVEYYRGQIPDFYTADLATVSGMFFSNGRLYYTKTGSSALYMRPFSTDSGVVGATAQTVATSGFADVAGMFLSGNSLYWASQSTGRLNRMSFSGGAPSGGSTVVDSTRDWRTDAMFLAGGAPAPANIPPTASFTSSCTGSTCSFDASASSDPDGTVASYAWNFGDNSATGTGVKPSHTYAASGSFTVTLTVTDDHGATATTTRQVTASSATPTGSIGFRASADAHVKSAASVSVTVPAAVQAGDGLVLAVSVNPSVTVAAPSGWAAEGSQATGNLVTTVLSRVAAASDANSTVTVGLSGTAKATLQLSAYSGTSSGDPVASVVGASDTGGTSHTTPTAAAASGDWVVSVWSDKQAAARTWTPPASGTTVRSNLAATGAGDIASLLADSGPTSAGQVGGLTATVPSASNQATMLTVLLAPGSGQAPTGNQSPDAHIAFSCSGLTCSFDGSGSSDPDGSIASYAWNFGDGGRSTEVSPTHGYASASAYTVSLTVTDNSGGTNTATTTVPVSSPATSSGIGLRGASGVASRGVTSASVTVPGSVQAGDGLLLVLSTNSQVNSSPPTGWTQAATVTAGRAPTTQVFSRVASASDAGSTVTAALSGQATVTFQLLAYSGTAAGGPVASVTTASDGSGTQHTTPTGTAAAGSWVVSVWSDKQADARQWTAPSTTTVRDNQSGTGKGDIATLVADSGGPVTAGQVGGLTATVSSASNNATMLTVVLAAG